MGAPTAALQGNLCERGGVQNCKPSNSLATTKTAATLLVPEAAAATQKRKFRAVTVAASRELKHVLQNNVKKANHFKESEDLAISSADHHEGFEGVRNSFSKLHKPSEAKPLSAGPNTSITKRVSSRNMSSKRIEHTENDSSKCSGKRKDMADVKKQRLRGMGRRSGVPLSSPRFFAEENAEAATAIAAVETQRHGLPVSDEKLFSASCHSSSSSEEDESDNEGELHSRRYISRVHQIAKTLADDEAVKSSPVAALCDERQRLQPYSAYEGAPENDIRLIKRSLTAQNNVGAKRAFLDNEEEDGSQSLSFAALLAAVGNSSTGRSTLRRQLQALAGTVAGSTGAVAHDRPSRKPKPVDKAADAAATAAAIARAASGTEEAPVKFDQLQIVDEEVLQEKLPRVKEKQITRVVQYAYAKEDAKKWAAQVQQNKLAVQQQLGHSSSSLRVSSVAQAVADFSPADDFEKELMAAVNAADVTEQSIKNEGGLAPADPIRKQLEQQQVARLKFLLFSEQRRARHLKKIKSKHFRQKKRRAEQREEEKIMERLEVENPALADALKQKAEEKRAKMRLLRQQNARSKWASLAARFGGRDMQREITRQKQREVDEKRTVDRLARRQPGKDVFGSDSDAEGSRDSGAEQTGCAAVNELSPTEKALLLKKLQTAVDEEVELPKKGLLSMPFIRRGLEKQRQRTREEIYNSGSSDAEKSSDDEAPCRRRSKSEGVWKAWKARSSCTGDSDVSSDEEQSRFCGGSDDAESLSENECKPENSKTSNRRGNEKARAAQGGKKSVKGLKGSSRSGRQIARSGGASDDLNKDAVKAAEEQLEGLRSFSELDYSSELGNVSGSGRAGAAVGRQHTATGGTSGVATTDETALSCRSSGTCTDSGNKEETEATMPVFKSSAEAVSFFKQKLQQEKVRRTAEDGCSRRISVRKQSKLHNSGTSRAVKRTEAARDRPEAAAVAAGVEEANPWLIPTKQKKKKRTVAASPTASTFNEISATEQLEQLLLQGAATATVEEPADEKTGGTTAAAAVLVEQQNKHGARLKTTIVSNENRSEGLGIFQTTPTSSLASSVARLSNTDFADHVSVESAAVACDRPSARTTPLANFEEKIKEQRDLVRQAFVHDEDFEESFRQHMQEEEASSKQSGLVHNDGCLPGWGNWHGVGLKPRQHTPPLNQAKTSAPIAVTTAAATTARKGRLDGVVDSKRTKRPLVLINSERDRRISKYLVSNLPYPYTSAHQYEGMLHHPIGLEWNTADLHKRFIAPKINVRVGAILPPLQLGRRLPGAARDALLDAWDSKASKKQRTRVRL